MAKVNNQAPTPLWPWGGPRSVREKLVDRSQFDRKKRSKKGDPKNPALASAALLDFIGPAHSSDELRLPLPALPAGHDADLEGFLDRFHLHSAVERNGTEFKNATDRALSRVDATPDRIERLKALLLREAQMLDFIEQFNVDVDEIHRRMREEQNTEGY